MAKFILTEDFSKTYTIDGTNYVHQVFKGDIVEGTIVQLSSGKKVKVPISVANRPNSFFIPINFVKKANNKTQSYQSQSSFDGETTESTQSSMFTTKRVVIGLVGIALIYGILKMTKTIK